MATALNVAQTSYSYGDAMLLMRASELTRVRIIAYLVDLFSLSILVGFGNTPGSLL